MILFPAIDLKDGKCVRLSQGDYNKSIIYGDPVMQAKKWQAEGAQYLHLVDLNGAKDGYLVNEEIIKKIISTVDIPIELGGGIRSLKDIKYVLDLGITRVILGSIAVKNIDILKEAIKIHGPEKIIVGVDTKNFLLATEGWLELTKINALDFCRKLEEVGVETIIFTDISRDGMLSGLNIDQLKVLLDNTTLKIIASGGVKDESDILKAQEIGCSGVVLGKALYNSNIDFSKISKLYRS